MRIIGGKDFYDSARAFGADPDNIFVRHNHDKTELEKFEKFSFLDFYRSPDNLFYIDVLFCGMVYHGIVFIEEFHNQTTKHFIWNANDLHRLEEKFNFKVNTSPYTHYSWSTPSIDDIDGHFVPRKMTPDELDFVIDKKIAVAIRNTEESKYDRKKQDWWKVNTDGLKYIGFATVIDPYTAFQELSMFLGGVIPKPGNPMVEIAGEKIMVQKHGMNEWSFRRHKDD